MYIINIVSEKHYEQLRNGLQFDTPLFNIAKPYR